MRTIGIYFAEEVARVSNDLDALRTALVPTTCFFKVWIMHLAYLFIIFSLVCFFSVFDGHVNSGFWLNYATEKTSQISWHFHVYAAIILFVIALVIPTIDRIDSKIRAFLRGASFFTVGLVGALLGLAAPDIANAEPGKDMLVAWSVAAGGLSIAVIYSVFFVYLSFLFEAPTSSNNLGVILKPKLQHENLPNKSFVTTCRESSLILKLFLWLPAICLSLFVVFNNFQLIMISHR